MTSTEAVLTLNRLPGKARKKIYSTHKADSFTKTDVANKGVEAREDRSLRDVLRIKLVGANPTARIEGANELSD